MRHENNLRLGTTWEWHENGNANGNGNGNGMEETNINANTNANRDAMRMEMWMGNWSQTESETEVFFACFFLFLFLFIFCLFCLLRWQRQHKYATSSNAMSLLGAKLLCGGSTQLFLLSMKHCTLVAASMIPQCSRPGPTPCQSVKNCCN